MKAYTTIEESKRLIEAGLDVNTADMCYDLYEDDTTIPLDKRTPLCCSINELEVKEYLMPCWSLAALLNIINQNNITYHLYSDFNNEGECIVVSHVDKYGMEAYAVKATVTECILWLLKENYINYDTEKTSSKQ